jgi:hypothetical protein
MKAKRQRKRDLKEELDESFMSIELSEKDRLEAAEEFNSFRKKAESKRTAEDRLKAQIVTVEISYGRLFKV